MTDPGNDAAGKQATQQQAEKIGGDNETDQGGRKTFDLGTHTEQGRKQSVSQQQQSVTEQK